MLLKCPNIYHHTLKGMILTSVGIIVCEVAPHQTEITLYARHVTRTVFAFLMSKEEFEAVVLVVAPDAASLSVHRQENSVVVIAGREERVAVPVEASFPELL